MLLALCYGGSGQLQLTKERICNSICKLVRGRWWGLLVQLMAEGRSESALGKPRMRLVERDLVKLKQSLRKVRIDVEGSMGPYY